MKNNKKLIVALILMLVIGFASVSTTLVLTGVVGIGENKDDFKVIFTKAKLNGVAKNNFIDKNTKQTITYETDVLSLVDDTSVLEYEVTNTSRNYDADVTINLEVPENDYVYIEFEPKTMFIEAGKSKSGSVTVKLKKSVNEDKIISMRCGFKVNSRKRESLGAEYVEPFSRAGTMMAAAINAETGEKEKYWSYSDKISKIVFEDKNNYHETTADLTFDVSENQDGSVMADLVPLKSEEKDLLLEKFINNAYKMTLEEYKQELIEVYGDKASIHLMDLKYELFGVSEEEFDVYFSEYFKSNTGMTLEEYKKKAIEEQGITEDEFNQSLEEMKKETFNNIEPFDTYTLYIQSNTGINLNQNCKYMFATFFRLIEIEGLEYVNTSNVTDMSNMFRGCYILPHIDLSNFDTSKVVDMSFMFFDCQHLHELNLSSFDTSNVTNMSNMFSTDDEDVYNFRSLDLSNFDTSNVTDMSEMFHGCYALTSLDISNFNTSKVTDMTRMFAECINLTGLDLKNFNTESVTNMTAMFAMCEKLTNVNLSSFNTSKVTSMSYMFNRCKKLANLNLKNFDTSNVSDFSLMFGSCESLTDLDLSNFRTTSSTNMGRMFAYCSNLISLDLSNFDTSKVKYMNEMFNYCSSLTDLDISNFDITNVTSYSSMFSHTKQELIIKVHDTTVQNWILSKYNGHPSSWTSSNVIIV